MSLRNMITKMLSLTSLYCNVLQAPDLFNVVQEEKNFQSNESLHEGRGRSEGNLLY